MRRYGHARDSPGRHATSIVAPYLAGAARQALTAPEARLGPVAPVTTGTAGLTGPAVPSAARQAARSGHSGPRGSEDPCTA